MNPEMVPDNVAYVLLFRLLSNRRTDEEKNRARSYLEMVFGCDHCSQTNLQGQVAPEKAYSRALLAVVNESEQRVGALDRKAKRLHDQYWPDPSHEVLAQLNEMQKQKETILAELVASLPSRLGEKGMEKLKRHVSERVKRRVKIYPDHIHS